MQTLRTNNSVLRGCNVQSRCPILVVPRRRPAITLPLACNASANAMLPLDSPAAAVSVVPGCVEKLEGPLAPTRFNLLSVFSRAAMLFGIAFVVALSTAGNAFAARTGGRAGGMNFAARRPAMGTSMPRTLSSGRSTHHTTVMQSGLGWGMPSFFYPVMPFGYYGSGGGNPVMTILLVALVGLCAVQAFNTLKGSRGSSSVYGDEDEDEPPVTVARVQVGLLAVAKELKTELDMLAARADTSTPEGLHLILQETVLALMRNPQYCVFGASSSKVVPDVDDAERMFQAMSMEERAKFKEETLVNVKGVVRKSQITSSKGSDGGMAELITVTLMVAAEGEFELPAIRSLTDLKLALSKIGGTPASAILAAELMWTPQAEGDVMTQEDCLAMYPSLVPL